MDAQNPSIISHVSIGVRDFDRAAAFYDAVMATLGCKRVLEFPGAVAYGKAYPEFWIQTPIDGKSSSAGNGTHIAFVADSPAMVQAFYDAALQAGARDEGKPGPRADYSEAYHGCFVRDLDGHKIEATYWDESKAPMAHQH